MDSYPRPMLFSHNLTELRLKKKQTDPYIGVMVFFSIQLYLNYRLSYVCCTVCLGIHFILFHVIELHFQNVLFLGISDRV